MLAARLWWSIDQWLVQLLAISTHLLLPLLCCAQRLPHNLYYLTTLRKFSFAGALYLLLTWMFPLAGLLYFVAPKVRSWDPRWILLALQPVGC